MARHLPRNLGAPDRVRRAYRRPFERPIPGLQSGFPHLPDRMTEQICAPSFFRPNGGSRNSSCIGSPFALVLVAGECELWRPQPNFGERLFGPRGMSRPVLLAKFHGSIRIKASTPPRNRRGMAFRQLFFQADIRGQRPQHPRVPAPADLAP